jgi:hypothetical protein
MMLKIQRPVATDLLVVAVVVVAVAVASVIAEVLGAIEEAALGRVGDHEGVVDGIHVRDRDRAQEIDTEPGIRRIVQSDAHALGLAVANLNDDVAIDVQAVRAPNLPNLIPLCAHHATTRTK